MKKTKNSAWKRVAAGALSGIVKKCAVIEYPKSEIGIYQAA